MYTSLHVAQEFQQNFCESTMEPLCYSESFTMTTRTNSSMATLIPYPRPLDYLPSLKLPKGRPLTINQILAASCFFIITVLILTPPEPHQLTVTVSRRIHHIQLILPPTLQIPRATSLGHNPLPLHACHATRYSDPLGAKIPHSVRRNDTYWTQ
jgi:hypothetical protein